MALFEVASQEFLQIEAASEEEARAKILAGEGNVVHRTVSTVRPFKSRLERLKEALRSNFYSAYSKMLREIKEDVILGTATAEEIEYLDRLAQMKKPDYSGGHIAAFD